MKGILYKLLPRTKLTLAIITFIVSMIMFYLIILKETGFVFGLLTGFSFALSAILFALYFENPKNKSV